MCDNQGLQGSDKWCKLRPLTDLSIGEQMEL